MKTSSFLYIVLGSTGSETKSALHTTSRMRYTRFIFKTDVSVCMLAAYSCVKLRGTGQKENLSHFGKQRIAFLCACVCYVPNITEV